MTFKQLVLECFKKIIDCIDEQKRNLNNRELLKICEPLGQIWKGDLNPHLPHKIAEAALNFLIREKYAAKLLIEKNPKTSSAEILKPLTSRLPTQSWRSREQINFQQFSTPLPIAYLLAYILDIKPNDSVLEPSTGTGNLAIWASSGGAKVETNEIDPRRCELLKCLDFEPITFNAELLTTFFRPKSQPIVC